MTRLSHAGSQSKSLLAGPSSAIKSHAVQQKGLVKRCQVCPPLIKKCPVCPPHSGMVVAGHPSLSEKAAAGRPTQADRLTRLGFIHHPESARSGYQEGTSAGWHITAEQTCAARCPTLPCCSQAGDVQGWVIPGLLCNRGEYFRSVDSL